MRIFRFDPEKAKEIRDYGSANAAIWPLARLSGPARVSYIRLAANGLIGYHQAAVPQLFCVVEGEGWVRGESSGRTPISRGQAALWEKNEWHESGTDSGMTAFVIESEMLSVSE